MLSFDSTVIECCPVSSFDLGRNVHDPPKLDVVSFCIFWSGIVIVIVVFGNAVPLNNGRSSINDCWFSGTLMEIFLFPNVGMGISS